MRDNTTMKHVRTTTTGYIEADMLGQTLIIAEEMKNKQRSPQQPHRNGMIKDKLSGVLKWFQTAPTACLRSLKVLKGKGKEIYNRTTSCLRKLFVNGK